MEARPRRRVGARRRAAAARRPEVVAVVVAGRLAAAAALIRPLPLPEHLTLSRHLIIKRRAIRWNKSGLYYLATVRAHLSAARTHSTAYTTPSVLFYGGCMGSRVM